MSRLYYSQNNFSAACRCSNSASNYQKHCLACTRVANTTMIFRAVCARASRMATAQHKWQECTKEAPCVSNGRPSQHHARKHRGRRTQLNRGKK
eukprot:4205827-Alexandrium_andersonii.AAC.1